MNFKVGTLVKRKPQFNPRGPERITINQQLGMVTELEPRTDSWCRVRWLNHENASIENPEDAWYPKSTLVIVSGIKT